MSSPYPQGRLHRSRSFEIPGLSGRYPLTVYLPPDYDHSRKRYPIAYMFDGQNLFGDEGSFVGGWHLHEALDKHAAKGHTVPIVIGIHHGGPTRVEELTPWRMGRNAAKGDIFLNWVTGPLAKMADEDLRILKGPENTMVGGASLGGLMALYAHFRHPEAFGRVLSMSPALWIHNGQIFRYVHAQPTPWTRRLYLDAGERERGTFQQARDMATLLARKGYGDSELMWRPDAKGSHNERNWRRRLPKAIRFLYD